MAREERAHNRLGFGLSGARRAGVLTAVYVLAAALVVGAGGCRKTAIRPGDPRSQFEQYDRSRSEHVEPFVQDEFGRRKPNLRARLLRGG